MTRSNREERSGRSRISPRTNSARRATPARSRATARARQHRRRSVDADKSRARFENRHGDSTSAASELENRARSGRPRADARRGDRGGLRCGRSPNRRRGRTRPSPANPSVISTRWIARRVFAKLRTTESIDGAFDSSRSRSRGPHSKFSVHRSAFLTDPSAGPPSQKGGCSGSRRTTIRRFARRPHSGRWP